MAIGAEFRAYLSDVFGSLGKLSTRRVFGLDGIFLDGILLGFVIDGRIHFRTDETSLGDYVRGGGKPYAFTKRTGEHIVTSYYSLPERIYDEPEELLRWAQHAHAAAMQSPSAKKRRAARARRVAKSGHTRDRHPPRSMRRGPRSV
jgi:DNA transformation protein